MIGFRGRITTFSTIILSGCLAFLLLEISCNRTESEENQKQPEIPSKNVHISPQSCRPCHKAIVDSFLLTGKGRSLLPASESDKMADWNIRKPVFDEYRDLFYLPQKIRNEFYILEFRLESSDTIHVRREKVSQVVGSGNQTVSFFREEQGYLYEMPLTWYRRKALWDLSPGYEKGGNQGFDREIGTECLECHSSGFQPVAHSVNRYHNTGNALSCNSCHGDLRNHPGKKSNSKGVHQDEILKINKLDPLIQMDICRQCHLEGIKVPREKPAKGSFAPGKRFSDYFEVFIEGSGNQEFGFASHSERLQMSRCFIQSGGNLTCTGCHDPHTRLPSDSKSFFNKKCMNCHGGNAHQTACKISKPGKSDCISCHLRKSGTSDIPHVNSTDHWIRKQPERAIRSSGEKELRHFAGQKYSTRELGLAQLHQAETSGDSIHIQKVKKYLNSLLPEEKLRYQYLLNIPGLPDADTNFFAGTQNPMLRFQWAEVKKRSGLPWYSDLIQACNQAPDRLEFLYRKALADEETGRKPDYKGIIQKKLLHPEANLNLGFEALQAGNYPTAERYFKNSLKGNPDKILARENLARCFLESGKFQEARKELERLIRINPTEQRYKQALNSIP